MSDAVRRGRTASDTVLALVVFSIAGALADLIPTLMGKMATAEFRALQLLGPSQSIGSAAETPGAHRGLPPAGHLARRGGNSHREDGRLVLAPEMLIGNKDLYVADDALNLECLSPAVMAKADPLCSEALFFSPEKVLIRTEASADAWVGR